MLKGEEASTVVDFNDLAQTVKLVGIFFLLADYNKYALGFFQLASMVELTIVIRETINQIKKVSSNKRESTKFVN